MILFAIIVEYFLVRIANVASINLRIKSPKDCMIHDPDTACRAICKSERKMNRERRFQN